MVEERFRAGFKDNCLDAEYVCTDFSFNSSIPLVGRTREGALFDLAEKIVDKKIPYCAENVLLLTPSHKPLSLSDLEHISSSIYCILHSNKE